MDRNIEYENIINEVTEFIKQSKNNKRLLKIKMNRLKKVELFLDKFV